VKDLTETNRKTEGQVVTGSLSSIFNRCFWTLVLLRQPDSTVYRSLLVNANGEIRLVDKCSSLGSSGLLSGSLLSGNAFLGSVVLEEFVVGLGGFARGFDGVDLVSLEDGLSAESLLGDHSLDLRGLVVSLVTLLDFTVNDIFADVVQFTVESESLDDSVSSLKSESVGTLNIVASSNVFVSLLDDTERNDSKIGSSDASTDGLSLSVTSSSGSESSSLFLEENASSSGNEDTLFHLESLFVISSSDSEDVTLVVGTKVLSVNFLTHSLVKEGTNVFLVINFNFLVSSGKGVGDVKLHSFKLKV